MACPPPAGYNTHFNGRSYKYYTTLKNQPDAEAQCQSDGGQLALFYDVADYNYFHSLSEYEQWWVVFLDETCHSVPGTNTFYIGDMFVPENVNYGSSCTNSSCNGRLFWNHYLTGSFAHDPSWMREVRSFRYVRCTQMLEGEQQQQPWLILLISIESLPKVGTWEELETFALAGLKSFSASRLVSRPSMEVGPRGLLGPLVQPLAAVAPGQGAGLATIQLQPMVEPAVVGCLAPRKTATLKLVLCWVLSKLNDWTITL